MSKLIAIMGESGSGKTTSCRNLNPAETFYIDADKKGLSWRGWRAQYNTEAQNYFRGSGIVDISKCLRVINEKHLHIKHIVIDTINGIMVDDEMSRRNQPGYDKWMDLAGCIWDLIGLALGCRDDLTIIMMAHTQTERDDAGYVFTRIKTSGRKLDKIVLESKFTTVLHARCADGRYIFETQAKNSTAKSPMGAFEDLEIPNDIVAVIAKMEEF